MKKAIIIIVFLLFGIVSYEQVLLEDKDGQQIANNFFDNFQRSENVSLIKLNTGEQSLGFDYFISSVLHDPANYHIHQFGVKAKSTEGFASVFAYGQFSPGIHLEYAYTQVNLFSDKTNYVDWGGISLGYDINKYNLYKKDTTFSNQFYTKNFKALKLLANYNALIKTKWILNLKVGYSRQNNYDDLTSVEIQDISTEIDPTTLIERQTIKKHTAKEDNFKEFDAYPFILAITKATSTDDINTPAGLAKSKKLKLGYTIYLKNIAAKASLPNTNAGIIFFLTKQDKNGVRSPVFGLNIQATDPFDVNNKNNGLQTRTTIGFTTIFTL